MPSWGCFCSLLQVFFSPSSSPECFLSPFLLSLPLSQVSPLPFPSKRAWLELVSSLSVQSSGLCLFWLFLKNVFKGFPDKDLASCARRTECAELRTDLASNQLSDQFRSKSTSVSRLYLWLKVASSRQRGVPSLLPRAVLVAETIGMVMKRHCEVFIPLFLIPFDLCKNLPSGLLAPLYYIK